MMFGQYSILKLFPDLTPSDVWALEVRVEEDVEVKGRLLAGVVDADVEVELLLPQDDPVGDAELVLGRNHANLGQVRKGKTT